MIQDWRVPLRCKILGHKFGPWRRLWADSSTEIRICLRCGLGTPRAEAPEYLRRAIDKKLKGNDE
jgi:hypothetical protein